LQELWTNSQVAMVECLVLPGIGGVAVQCLLLACCVGVFVFKRKKEEKRLGPEARSKEEFTLDASKQFASAAWLHCMNLGFASALNTLMAGGDECGWYWINIMVDTTLGTAVAYVLLLIANAFLKKKLTPAAAEEFRSGEYKADDGYISMKRYMKQLCLWLVVVSFMKVLMVLFMFLFSGPLMGIAGFVLAPFLSEPWLKLLVVMIAFPLVMDSFQIWMVDNFIKKRETHAIQGTVEDLEAAPELDGFYVERSAEALLILSERCEEAAEEALPYLRTKCDEAMHADKSTEFAGSAAKKAYPSANFETQYKFQTIIPPDQAIVE